MRDGKYCTTYSLPGVVREKCMRTTPLVLSVKSKTKEIRWHPSMIIDGVIIAESLRMSVLVSKVSFQVVFSREAVL